MRAGTCVHFTGLQACECKAGVNYRKHVGGPHLGWGLRLPCIVERGKSRDTFTPAQQEEIAKAVPCEKWQEPTAEQIAESERAIQEAIDRLTMALPLCQQIKIENKGKDWQGVMVCPACMGRLLVSHSGLNGHVWGKCETKGCMSWVE